MERRRFARRRQAAKCSWRKQFGGFDGYGHRPGHYFLCRAYGYHGRNPVRNINARQHCHFSRGYTVDRFEFFVDGVRFGQCSLGERFTLDTTQLADGHHELRVVAIEASPVETQGRWIMPVSFDNHGRRLVLEAEPRRVKPSGTVRVTVKGDGLEGVVIFAMGRVLGRTTKGDASIEVPAELLGRGSVTILRHRPHRPRAINSVNAAPVTIEMAATGRRVAFRLPANGGRRPPYKWAVSLKETSVGPGHSTSVTEPLAKAGSFVNGRSAAAASSGCVRPSRLPSAAVSMPPWATTIIPSTHGRRVSAEYRLPAGRQLGPRLAARDRIVDVTAAPAGHRLGKLCSRSAQRWP